MKILFLSNWYPYPPRNGSELRVYNLLRGLEQYHDISLISFAENRGRTSPPPELERICKKVHVVQKRPYNPRRMRALMGLFSPTPRVLVDRYVPAMADRVDAEIQSGGYDLLIASQWYMASYYRGQIPAIFEEAEVGVFVNKRANAPSVLHKIRHGLTSTKLKYYLRRLMFRFRSCTVVSEEERSLLKNMVPGYDDIEVIPNGVNLSDYEAIQEKPETNSLIFTGSFKYRPNYEAMLWFVREVYPRVVAEVPGVQLVITGDNANLPFPKGDSIYLTGFVDDVRPLIASAWISLAPIWYGGGTRLKILEAMALRTPVIATSKGAEGLEARNGEHLFVADSPEDFTKMTIRLLKEPGLRKQLVANAYQLVCEKYDWRVIMPKFLDLVERSARS